MKLEKALPKTLPGAVVAQYRTHGDRTYGPYWFRFWREGGRLRKAYVRAPDLEEVRAACEANRKARASVAGWRSQARLNRSDLALLGRLLRRVWRDGDAATMDAAEAARLAGMGAKGRARG